MATQKILILGGGFGGVKAALELCGQPDFEVTVLSDRPDFRFYPALYETATGRRKSASSIPLAEIFDGKSVRLVSSSAQQVDRSTKKVTTKDGQSYGYDILILALGVVTNFFGIKGLDKYAYGIKTEDEAQRLRSSIHKQLVEQAQPDVNYVVIGGGPTGIELAGALPTYIKHIIKRHGLKTNMPHIDLVEASPRLAPRMPAGYSRSIAKRLQKLGVNLYLNQKVEAETADALMVSGHSIKSHSVVWTAGVTNHPFLKTNDFKLDEHGKAIVDEHLSGGPDIYIIGDNAATKYSGMAQTAVYDAKFIANNLKRQVDGKKPYAYKPKQPVYITPAGPHWAAVQWGGFRFYGLLGWLLRGAADLVAYHDFEPLNRASKHWLAEGQSDASCPVCDHH